MKAAFLELHGCTVNHIGVDAKNHRGTFGIAVEDLENCRECRESSRNQPSDGDMGVKL